MHFLCPARSFCALVVLLLSCTAFSQQPAAFFAEQCSGCHTIGGGAGAGPDLKGVGERRERAWLIKFIHDPQAVLAGKDPSAVALQKEFAGIEMPAFPDIPNAQAEALLDYIAHESGAAAPLPDAQPVADAQTIGAGQQLFMGDRRLARGGAACISCHTVRGIGGLGGGRLGPDLTRSFERLGGGKGISAWLGATPTPVMAAAYKRNPLTPEEIAAVSSFLQQAGNAGAAGNRDGRLKFIALAVGCTLLGFVAIGGTWRRRLRSIREHLVSRRGEL